MMMMMIAHKIALDPNDVQETYCRKAAGIARVAYNGALEMAKQYDAWNVDPFLPQPSDAALRRQLNTIKEDRFSCMLEVTKNAPQTEVIPLTKEYKNFFTGQAEYPTR